MVGLLHFCFLIFTYFFNDTFGNSIHGNAVASHGCDGRVFIEDSVVIDVSLQANCILQIETDEDHILAFSVVQGKTFSDASEFFTIHDGVEENSPSLLLENQIVYEVANKNLPLTIYSTKSTATLRFNKAPNSSLHLKIQKAVGCPFNLGIESQCGRIVDEVSCYCATFTKRSQASSSNYCISNQMRLLSIEDRTEEEAIHVAWGASVRFWTSCTDLSIEGKWFWESTGSNLYPGYANWAVGEPDQSDTEDCMITALDSIGGWGDVSCSGGYDAVCEAHP